MPVKVNNNLPAIKFLEKENIFVMGLDRANMQDIRPLRVAILNLMPNKEDTEKQLIRLISNSPLQVEIVLLHTHSYESKNTAKEYLASFYKTFEEVKDSGLKFDGLIITGAPVEKLDFLEVAYWGEMEEIMDWAKHYVYSTLYICWAAQAGLYYHYGIDKHDVAEKIFGIYQHKLLDTCNPLVRGFDETFLAPHSRHTTVFCEDILACDKLSLLASSDEAGAYLCCSKDLRNVFVFGHGEYDADTLNNEYKRDLAKGQNIKMPVNYYPHDDPSLPPTLSWRAHSALLYSNWLNYCVYQLAPFDIEKISDV